MMLMLIWTWSRSSECMSTHEQVHACTCIGRLQRLRSEREHQQFPDEVDTPIDKLAKTRFQK